MKKILLLSALLLVGCSSKKVQVQKTEQTQSLQTAHAQGIAKQSQAYAEQTQKNTQKIELLRNSLQLEALGEKPAKYTEIHGRDTLVQIIIENAKVQTTRLNQLQEQAETSQFTQEERQEQALQTLQQQEKKEVSQTQTVQVRRGDTQIVKALKYLAILAVVALLGWIFWRVKRF